MNIPIITFIALTMASMITAPTQSNTPSRHHYDQGGLAFDYPDGWTVAENNNDERYEVVVSPNSGPARVRILISKPINTCDFEAEKANLIKNLLDELRSTIKVRESTVVQPVRTTLGDNQIEGGQLHGTLQGRPVTAELYTTRLSHRFVSFVYVTTNTGPPADETWSIVRKSLQIKPAVIVVGNRAGADKAESTASMAGNGPVLNGKAISLPQPEYPPIARQAHASGIVVVQVIINENGDVTQAHAVSGHPLLQAVSVAAAKEAKFSPTKVCDEAVQVTGVISYSFVAH